LASGEASECQTPGKAEDNSSETWHEIRYTETRTRLCWIVVKWYGAFGASMERGDYVAVQGMWRSALGHAFLQRNY